MEEYSKVYEKIRRKWKFCSELQKRKNFENQYLEILSKDVCKVPFLKESNEGEKALVCGIFRIGSTFEILVFHQVSPADALRAKVH